MRIQTLSKTEQVRRAILIEILRGELRPGQRLIEAALSNELGVSQATVNAALQDLHNQGLVTKLLNRSTNINRYTDKEIRNLFSVRALLEPAAAAEVAGQWGAEAKERLEEQVRQMRSAARRRHRQDFCLADYTFHQEVYSLTRNSFLIQACQAIAAAPFAYILCDHLQALPTDYAALAEDHQELIRAMEAGPEEAARTMRSCIEQWLSHSLSALTAVRAVPSEAQ
jgi:DNA-binding GntR family transcriptional regulator